MTGQVELSAVIAAVQTAVEKVTGIRYAPEYPPGDVTQFPAAIIYPSQGHYTTGRAGIAEGYISIVVEIHIPQKDLARDVEALLPYWKSIPDALEADPTLNKNVEFGERISYAFGPMKYGGTDTIGWRFVLENLKIYPYGFKDKW